MKTNCSDALIANIWNRFLDALVNMAIRGSAAASEAQLQGESLAWLNEIVFYLLRLKGFSFSAVGSF